MTSNRDASDVYALLTTQRSLTVIAAIVVAVPVVYVFNATVETDGFSGSFLLLLTLAVVVPSAYDGYWPNYADTWTAIAWVVVACFVATVQFTGLYVLGTTVLDLSPSLSSAGAFLVTGLGDLTLLTVWHDAEEST